MSVLSTDADAAVAMVGRRTGTSIEADCVAEGNRKGTASLQT